MDSDSPQINAIAAQSTSTGSANQRILLCRNDSERRVGLQSALRSVSGADLTHPGRTGRSPKKVGFLTSLLRRFWPRPPDCARFPQNGWHFGALSRVPKNVWLSGVRHGLDSVIARDFVRARTFLSLSPRSGRESSLKSSMSHRCRRDSPTCRQTACSRVPPWGRPDLSAVDHQYGPAHERRRDRLSSAPG
jgi:hypothetical protein